MKQPDELNNVKTDSCARLDLGLRRSFSRLPCCWAQPSATPEPADDRDPAAAARPSGDAPPASSLGSGRTPGPVSPSSTFSEPAHASGTEPSFCPGAAACRRGSARSSPGSGPSSGSRSSRGGVCPRPAWGCFPGLPSSAATPRGRDPLAPSSVLVSFNALKMLIFIKSAIFVYRCTEIEEEEIHHVLSFSQQIRE